MDSANYVLSKVQNFLQGITFIPFIHKVAIFLKTIRLEYIVYQSNF